ncbi:peptidase [Sphingomonas sp. MAH-20]|uniref:Peptidase n=1 Tax=Sphingomonas horti TaxID=2682842 RepID=A0A6I4IWZ1_9SPHN|nr:MULTISPECIES: M67 family metallopeptidase [Sphingomonas]MBA2920299.1 M67 family metallopeptidase [Sphingomonas sp. CGMCC 1.13658]MVO76553.1 peptidase [Sphingomonas horti]
MRVGISRTVLDAIRSHAAAEAPREACGLLLGSVDLIDGVMAAVNVADDPVRHFEIDPAALFAAIRAERTGGPKLAGYYHSHPGGRAAPSDTDEAMAARDGKLWLIVAGDAVTAWIAGEGGFERVALSAS